MNHQLQPSCNKATPIYIALGSEQVSSDQSLGLHFGNYCTTILRKWSDRSSIRK